MRALFFTLTFGIFCSSLPAQEERELLQVAGFVYEAETGLAMPYAHVVNRNLNLGKVTSAEGYFTTLAYPGDTLAFSSVGFKDHLHVVRADARHIEVEMEIDVQQLPETEILPLPKTLLTLRQDMRNREIVNASTILRDNMENAGFKAPPTHPTPPPPSILNPISFIYDRIIKKIQQRRPKKGRADELPALDIPALGE